MKILNQNNIAVIIIRNAFLDDENRILARLNNALKYEVKALRTSVISMEYEEYEVENINNHTKEINIDIMNDSASLQLYVYGLDNTTPVLVERLIRYYNLIYSSCSLMSILKIKSNFYF